MRKSLKKLAAAAVLACSLVMGSVSAFAFNGMLNNPMLSVYSTEQLNAMTAIMKTMQAANMTMTINLDASLDGKEMLNGQIVLQNGEDSKYSRYDFQMVGETMDRESCTVDGVTITRDGDAYTLEKAPVTGAAANTVTNAETARAISSEQDMAALLAMISLIQSDGDVVYIDMKGEEASDFLLGTIVSIIPTQSGGENAADNNVWEMDMLAQVTEGMRIESLYLEASHENLFLSAVKGIAVISFTDADGAAHEELITLTVTFTEIGTTVPSIIDTTDKTVIDISAGA